MKLVFFGTPEFAVPSLNQLHRAGHTVLLVICQPDRPAGRGRHTKAPAIKILAASLGLPVEQPESLGDSVRQRIQALSPEVAVVVAYGMILPADFLRIPCRGCVNLHASLLPRYRGAAPVAHALLKGEQTVGVTTLLMDEGIDTGPLLLQRELHVMETETTGEVESRLAIVGADLLVETLEGLGRGVLEGRTQQVDRETYAPKILPEAARLHWTADSIHIARQVRAFNPRPGATTSYHGLHVKIWRAVPCQNHPPSVASPGTLVDMAGALHVVCGAGSCLDVLEVQAEGRRRVSGAEALRGRWFEPGDRFGDGKES